MRYSVAKSLDNTKNFIQNNLGHISLFVFVCGFLLDSFTLPDVTDMLSVFIGLTYMLLVGALIILREYLRSDRLNFENEEKYLTYLGLIISFFSGSFSSFVFIYYLRGADVSSSWPVFLLLFIFMIANEFLRSKKRVVFDLLLYAICVSLLFIFMLPSFVKMINDYVFVGSVVLSFLFLYLYLKKFYFIVGDYMRTRFYNYILIIPMLILGAYFLKLIPAVPLTLNNSGVYLSVVKDINTNSYFLSGEGKRDWFDPFYKSFLAQNLNSISYYAEIKAPTNLEAVVSHKWEYYDATKGVWQERANISYYIKGGREGGYRGYTTISNNLKSGKYRVSVIVDGKRKAGSTTFLIE
jgi:hypothetical protein